MVTLKNDCLECLNAFDDLVMVSGHLVRKWQCEYQHGTFPHAINCPTAQYETANSKGIGIGDEIAIPEDDL